MNQEDQGRKMGLVVSKAWADEAFKKRLLADATAVLKEEGVTVPDGVEVKAVEDSPTIIHLVLPAAKPTAHLSQEDLDVCSGGAGPCRNVKYGTGFYSM